MSAARLPSRFATAPLAAGLLCAILMLAACHADDAWHLRNVRHLLPDLAFTMTRAGDDRRVDARDYRGRIVLLYFGYTHCPDICSTTLARLRATMQQLGAAAAGVQLLFVSVDPQRDGSARLADYVHSFDAHFVGLRGSAAQLVALARRYRVSFTKQAAMADGGYMMSHSSALFVFDGDGHARLLGNENTPVADLAADLRRLLDER